MRLEFFTTNIANPATLIPQIIKEWKTAYELKAFLEYNPKNHKVNNKRIRRDKHINVPHPGGELIAGTNDPVLVPKVEPVNRLQMALQKLITSRSTAFATAGGVSLKAKQKTPAEKKLFEILNDTWRVNKLHFKNSEIVKSIYSETECAEIWWTKVYEDKTFELRCTTYKPSDGYQLIPVFDPHQDLIAFGLGYTSEEGTVKTEHLDIYTAKELRKHTKSPGGDWTLTPSVPDSPNPVNLLYGKIPVIYYAAPASVWEDVQPLIERLEILKSNFADTNDYNGSPILLASGKILGFSAKGETGKVIETENGGDLKYVSSDQVPETVKLELETLVDDIFTLTQTPNFSFKLMASLGDISGEAWDRILIDSHLKASDMHNGIYGEGVQRRCNFLISAISSLYSETKEAYKLEITPVFKLFRMNDLKTRIENAMKANGGKPIATLKQSLEMADISDEIDETLEILNQEAAALKPVPVADPAKV